MNENIFKDLAGTIRLLKSQHGDKLAVSIASQLVMQIEIRKQLEQAHPYSITEYKDRWRTRVYDPTSKDKRKQIYGATKEEIYLKLIEWYGYGYQANMSMKVLYVKWMDYREKTVASPNTVLRNQQHYNKYFAKDEFWNTNIAEIKKPALKEYCIEKIQEYNLTRKEWNNAKGIMLGMFNYAVENDWMPSNPLSCMNFPVGFFRKPNKMVKEIEILNDFEVKSLMDWCEKYYAETEDVAYLFPILNINVGMRVGEVCALTWDDWDGERRLCINKEEIRNQQNGICTVAEHTKTHYDRTITLSDKAVKAFKRLKQASDPNIPWMFHRAGKRLRERQLIYVLERYARHMGIPYKSTHKLRKTFGSNLYAKAGFTPKQCAEYLGHNERTFLEHYNFDTSVESDLISKLNIL